MSIEQPHFWEGQSSPLSKLLTLFRENAQSEHEKGGYFERLVKVFLCNEPFYRDLYSGNVWLWSEWREESVRRYAADPGADHGIDLVAETADGEFHAIQAKFYDDDARLYLASLGSFFIASSKAHFTRRVLVTTSFHATTQLQEAVRDQKPPVTLISRFDLEASKIDWSAYQPAQTTARLKETKSLRDYQEKAISDVVNGLKEADRGKLIMACGTGKTFTALRLAERLAGAGGRVLFLVPSLNLLSQTLTEWTQEASFPIHAYAVCSDEEVGKKRRDSADDFEMLAHELQYPATTDAKALAQAVKKRATDSNMTVVFSTYHSIEVINRAQKLFRLEDFNLILCDEAHRTTGASFETAAGEYDESAFVRVHDPDFIHSAKRVYMTATPRVYGDAAKVKAGTESILLYSMDDETHFGKTLHTLTFSEAVNDLKILCDYKVLVLTIEEKHIAKSLQRLLANADNALNVSDAAKIVGCWRALSKMDTQADLSFDPEPMKRAVAFAQVIDRKPGARTHKVSSRHVAEVFEEVVEDYRCALIEENPQNPDAISHLRCEGEHVDGSMSAAEKNEKLEWLKAPAPENTCRILSNVRCLSEGVDVPALDAVLFLSPRNSQVDVVQSVGRVMRKPRDGNKKLGYVILPVVIPADKTPEEALNDNKTYRVVWEVLQALRSHDDRFDAMINRLAFDGQDTARMEVIAITDKIAPKYAAKSSSSKAQTAKSSNAIGVTPEKAPVPPVQPSFEFGDLERAIIATVVRKCGNRLYWDEWAQDIAKIAQTHITRLTEILDTPANVEELAAFDAFLADLHRDINNSITRAEAIEMLAQHMITRPVFDAMFEGYSFAEHNPVSQAMQGVLAVLERHHIEKEADALKSMYDSVKRRAADTKTVQGKQKLIVELYDKFFRNAFPKMAERLGIVYTPVEVVDFIIHSVNGILHREFNQTLGSRNVHILDPFTGTGTFITRLLQSGLIALDQLDWKYKNEIHANEIVLLAYYIAAINIEQVYHALAGDDYKPFDGICLTDTFNLPTGREEWHDHVKGDNSARLKRQRNLDIRVIIGNPPYSAGQSRANDNNQNLKYPNLDARIEATYAAQSTATLRNSLYDSYIRAIRWASDRIRDCGVIGFVSNAGWVEGNAAAGLRKCLAEEFTSIFVFHLRGNARTSGEQRRKEKDNVFGQGTRTPITITLLVKNPASPRHGEIFFHDIGDYLSRDEKLARIVAFHDITGIESNGGWSHVTPDFYGDWLNQRDGAFDDFISLGDKKTKGSVVLFENYSRGVATSRDAWAYNFSQEKLKENIRRSIDFYNSEVDRYAQACANVVGGAKPDVASFVIKDGTRFSWDRQQRYDVAAGKKYTLVDEAFVVGFYRPFTRMYYYFERSLNNCVYQMPRIFQGGSQSNRAICLSGVGHRGKFSVLIADFVPSLNYADVDNNQCFPLYIYESHAPQACAQENLFSAPLSAAPAYRRKTALTDAGLEHFQTAYRGEAIGKEDVFYYVYGLLHSPDYRDRYADNLSKQLPRVPRVASAADFWAFSRAGRELAELHIGYESVPLYPVAFDLAKPFEQFAPTDYRVTQMKFVKGTGWAKHDKTTVIYNHNVTIKNIPLEAYDYVVNGKSALEWVMERQAVTTHKESGIVNDANDWAIETMSNPAYPLELFQRVITVSLETLRIVASLPALVARDDG